METAKIKNCFMNNEDWEVTKEIYSNSVVEDGVIDVKVSLHDCIGLRRVPFVMRGGGCDGSDTIVPLQAPVVYEYCALSECFLAPIIRLSYQYRNDNDNELGDDDEYVLDSVNIEVRYEAEEGIGSPKEKLSSYHSQDDIHKEQSRSNDTDGSPTGYDHTIIHSNWLKWLQSNANEILEETKLSYSICDFIEHQAINFFNIIHKDDTFGYSAILFDDQKTINDNNVICVASESSASKDVDTVNETGVLHSSWNNSKMYSTVYIPKRNQAGTGTLPPLSPYSSLDEYAQKIIQDNWKEWIYFECPICFDKYKCDSEGDELPCRHFLCRTCTELYIQSICSELNLHRQSPFICPIISCKQGMKIKSSNYIISNENMAAINMWKMNLKFPKTSVLTICPRKSCRSTDMRRASSTLSETMVFCGTCKKAFCELCLNKYGDKECWEEHAFHSCDEHTALRLCRRYRNATDEIKLRADERWHWLKDYALARDEDISAKLWINENASSCPRCKQAIERSEGCFHMHCTLCGTHFCYECGEELFYPFYGTHHCWEEGREFDDFG